MVNRAWVTLSPLLFLLIMDILIAMMDKWKSSGVFEPFDRWGVRHRLSLYLDDVVVFLKPKESELLAMKEILVLFGDASDLVANLQKCMISPI